MAHESGVGERIKTIRMSKGISGAFVARQLKIHPSTLNKYENGERKVSADLLPVIAEALDVNVSSFFEVGIDNTSNTA